TPGTARRRARRRAARRPPAAARSGEPGTRRRRGRSTSARSRGAERSRRRPRQDHRSPPSVHADEITGYLAGMSDDHWAISNLLARYAELLNLGRIDEVGELFRYGKITSVGNPMTYSG